MKYFLKLVCLGGSIAQQWYETRNNFIYSTYNVYFETGSFLHLNIFSLQNTRNTRSDLESENIQHSLVK